MNIKDRIIRRIKSNRSLLMLKAKVDVISKHLLFLSFPNVKGYYLPYSNKSSIDQRQLYMISQGLSDWLIAKYTSEKVNIKTTDTVIDCGAFVGGFTIAAAKSGAKKVFSVEPSSRNFNCLNRNIQFRGFSENINTLNIALGSKKDTLRLNLSISGCDDSLLEPDEGDLGTFEEVEVKTLKEIIKENKIDPEHLYLKVEAEGFEPEVILGLEEYKPRVIVVDITPERDGKSPSEEIKNHLSTKGYKFTETHRCLFAVLN
jgi:FkbM family methyltransferase